VVDELGARTLYPLADMATCCRRSPWLGPGQVMLALFAFETAPDGIAAATRRTLPVSTRPGSASGPTRPGRLATRTFALNRPLDPPVVDSRGRAVAP
jgi:hypothetical protein